MTHELLCDCAIGVLVVLVLAVLAWPPLSRLSRKLARILLAIAGFLGCLQHCAGPARAEVAVTPELVATVQRAIKWRAPEWSRSRAASVAQALNETPDPALMLAVAVLESDLRPRGLAWHDGRKVADVGLMGVRCLLGTDGRCTNGPASGLTVAKLRDPVVNIRVAAAVLAAHRGDLRRYHGSSNPKDTYEARALALVAAFSGSVVKVTNARTRAHVRMIAAAVLRERNS